MKSPGEPAAIAALLDAVEQSCAVKQQLVAACGAQIHAATATIIQTLDKGGKLLLCGNGGSAADAQHVAGEFVGRFLSDRRPLPAIALTADSSVGTCIGNDYSFEAVFERQVMALARPEDLVVGISTSGNSRNVVRAIEAAGRAGCGTLGLTGDPGGKLRDVARICICVPSNVTARIQEAHITIWHVICTLVDAAIASEASA
ncbi:MAG: SIS domain-containing protein [Armatimonadetes bacterium]|nr:SIS domain-containing protein [Armatimonadota bacterium]MDE2207335.1 SIS domain-containing protein [Armatimonadota bacterium]